LVISVVSDSVCVVIYVYLISYSSIYFLNVSSDYLYSKLNLTAFSAYKS